MKRVVSIRSSTGKPQNRIEKQKVLVNNVEAKPSMRFEAVQLFFLGRSEKFPVSVQQNPFRFLDRPAFARCTNHTIFKLRRFTIIYTYPKLYPLNCSKLPLGNRQNAFSPSHPLQCQYVTPLILHDQPNPHRTPTQESSQTILTDPRLRRNHDRPR